MNKKSLYLVLLIAMVFCIILNCITISKAIQAGNSPAFSIFALCLCCIALFGNIIGFINSN